MQFVFLCACQWQTIIDKIPRLCWGIIVLIALYLLLKYVVQPLMTNCHETKMKKKSFEREKEWADFETTKASTDEALKNQVKDLKTEVSEKENALKVEKHNIELLEKQLKVYSDIFEKLNVEIKPKEKQ